MKKTQIEKKLRRKTNKDLVETIISSKKNKNWIRVAHLISTPKRKQVSINLDQISENCEEGDVVVIPGKVLGVGELDKKVRLIALSFSKTAEEKLKKAKIEMSVIYEEVKRNPEGKDVKIVTE